jgi:hypothetical protein
MQLAKHERRRRVLRRIAEAGGTPPSVSKPPVETPTYGKCHHIATSRNHPIPLFTFLREHDNDPALKVEVLSHFKHT